MHWSRASWRLLTGDLRDKTDRLLTLESLARTEPHWPGQFDNWASFGWPMLHRDTSQCSQRWKIGECHLRLNGRVGTGLRRVNVLTLHTYKGSPCGPSDPWSFAAPLGEGAPPNTDPTLFLYGYFFSGFFLTSGLHSRTDTVTMGQGGQWSHMSIPEPPILKSPSSDITYTPGPLLVLRILQSS